MGAAELHLTIEQGANFKHTLIYMDSSNAVIPLLNYAVRLQIKADYNAEEYLADFSTENGMISVVGAEGKIIINVPAEETADYTWRTGVYDLIIISPDPYEAEVSRLLFGTVTVIPNISAP